MKVPFSNCSVDCKEGFSKAPVGYHDCCFLCKKCPQNTYVNYSRKYLVHKCIFPEASILYLYFEMKAAAGVFCKCFGGHMALLYYFIVALALH